MIKINFEIEERKDILFTVKDYAEFFYYNDYNNHPTDRVTYTMAFVTPVRALAGMRNCSMGPL